jgi:hypothetical protein
MSKPVFVYKCTCGATTLTFEDKEYYLLNENIPKFFPDLNLSDIPSQETFACNHCVNRWGLDLCGCGSGEKVEECECGLGLPYQTIGKENYRCASAWI